MKTLALLTLLLFTGICSAQITERTMIDGKITVPVGDDPEGITIFNISSNQGTISMDDGTFRIPVAVGDELTFSALQFQEFKVVIDQRVMEAEELNVFISEAVTELPEVSVGEPDLSGNIEVDVNRIPVEEANLPDVTAAEINDHEWNFRPDEQTTPENAAMQASLMEDGMNFANIFRGIYSRRLAAINSSSEPVEEDMRRLYDDDFFQEHLDIKQENIHDFILYAEENGLTTEMVEEGNELDLIEFLVDQSRQYKNQAGE